MSTKSYTFIPYHLQDHKVQSWWPFSFSNARKKQYSFGGQKNNFFSSHGLCNLLFLTLGELGTCLQNLIPTRSVEHREENYFPQWSKLKFTKKGNFWQSKRHLKIVVLKIHTMSTCIGASSTHAIGVCLFLEKHQNLNFWWFYKVPQANCL